MMAKILGYDIRSKLERSYEFEVNKETHSVIVPPWHQKILDQSIEAKSAIFKEMKKTDSSENEKLDVKYKEK